MTRHATDPLEEVIRESGENWLIDFFAPSEQALPHLKRILEAVSKRAQERFPANVPQLSATALGEEYARNPHRIKAFLQALGSTRSPDMLLMAWRIIEGRDIKQVSLEYRLQKSFSLRVVLAASDDGPDETYESVDIDDAALLRHFGIMKMNESPVFDGFYALNVGSPSA